jgi:hypothetical protein
MQWLIYHHAPRPTTAPPRAPAPPSSSYTAQDSLATCPPHASCRSPLPPQISNPQPVSTTQLPHPLPTPKFQTITRPHSPLQALPRLLSRFTPVCVSIGQPDASPEVAEWRRGCSVWDVIEARAPDAYIAARLRGYRAVVAVDLAGFAQSARPGVFAMRVAPLQVRGMSHVTRHTSHITRHTSHVTRHTHDITAAGVLPRLPGVYGRRVHRLLHL